MKIKRLILTVCLLASFGCDVGNFTGLDNEILTVSVVTVGWIAPPVMSMLQPPAMVLTGVGLAMSSTV